jgi:indolepyruvate ferredoxin oxidoreductase beta subunit
MAFPQQNSRNRFTPLVAAWSFSVLVMAFGTAARAESPQYQRLQDALVRYEQIVDAGGWPAVPAGSTIEPGSADIQMAFEMMEAVRYLPYLHQGSTVIVNTQRILPPSVATGQATYPEDVLDELTNRDIRVIAVDAFSIAKAAGEVRTANVALVGALSVHLPVEAAVFERIIENRVPERFRQENMKAFAAGREAGNE